MKSFNLIILFLIKLPVSTRQDSIFQQTEKSSSLPSLQRSHSEEIFSKIQTPLHLRKEKSIRHIHLFPRKHKALNKHRNLDEQKPWNFEQLISHKLSKIVPRFESENVRRRPEVESNERPVESNDRSKSYPVENKPEYESFSERLKKGEKK